MTLRQDVLDDGYGGKIVGWLDSDLPSAELSRWQPRPATHPAVAAPVATIAAPIPAPPAPIPAPILAFRPAPVPAAVTATPPAPPPVVAAPVEDEDDWEWTIALARARAAAEETEVARAAKAAPVPRRARQETVPPPPVAKPVVAPPPVPVSRPALSMPAITMAAAEVIEDSWPKTEPLTPLDYDDYTNPTKEIVRVAPAVTKPAVAAAKPAPAARPVVHTVARSEMPTREYPRPPSEAPSTVIPVPKLPRITDRHTIQPVVAAPRRFPKGTRELAENKAKPEAPLGVAPPPPIRPAEDTQLGITPAPMKVVTLPRIPGLKRAASQA